MKTYIFNIAIAAMMLVGCTGNIDKDTNETAEAEVEMADVTRQSGEETGHQLRYTSYPRILGRD